MSSAQLTVKVYKFMLLCYWLAVHEMSSGSDHWLLLLLSFSSGLATFWMWLARSTISSRTHSTITTSASGTPRKRTCSSTGMIRTSSSRKLCEYQQIGLDVGPTSMFMFELPNYTEIERCMTLVHLARIHEVWSFWDPPPQFINLYGTFLFVEWNNKGLHSLDTLMLPSFAQVFVGSYWFRYTCFANSQLSPFELVEMTVTLHLSFVLLCSVQTTQRCWCTARWESVARHQQ